MSWQPIATAPRDGTVILLARAGEVYAGWWSEEVRWTRRPYGYYPWQTLDPKPGFDQIGSEAAGIGVIVCDGMPLDVRGPTHWMPLPEGPEFEDPQDATPAALRIALAACRDHAAAAADLVKRIEALVATAEQKEPVA